MKVIFKTVFNHGFCLKFIIRCIKQWTIHSSRSIGRLCEFDTELIFLLFMWIISSESYLYKKATYICLYYTYSRKKNGFNSLFFLLYIIECPIKFCIMSYISETFQFNILKMVFYHIFMISFRYFIYFFFKKSYLMNM